MLTMARPWRRLWQASPALADDVAADVMDIAGSEAGDAVSGVEESEPIVEDLEQIGLQGAGVDEFEGIVIEAEDAAGGAESWIEVGGVEGFEIIVSVVGMIEDGDLNAGGCSDGGHEIVPGG